MLARVVAVLVLVATAAHADEPADRAKELARRAFQMIDDSQDYAGASDMFMQAYDATKSLPYLMNAAVSLRKANLHQQAVVALRRYLVDAGESLTPELRKQIDDDIVEITNESARITVKTPGDAVDVVLDDHAAGAVSKSSPLVVLVATAGGKAHLLRGHREGMIDDERHLGALVPGQAIEVVLEPKRPKLTGTVYVTSVPEHAELFVRGESKGAAPQMLQLLPGDYEVFAKLAGYDDNSAQLAVEAGKSRDLVIRLRTTSWWTRNKTWLYIGGGVALVAGGILGASAINNALMPTYGTVIRH